METNILKLPNELLHFVLNNLSGCDLVAFAQSCRRFSNLCKTLRHLNFENRGSSLGKSTSQLTTFFEEHLNPSLLRSCNFNGCYWLSMETLLSFLFQCTNLEELYVAETELIIGYIGEGILPICPKITKLSFTLHQGDWANFFARTKTNRQLLKNLKKLRSIEIIASNDCEICETLRVLNYCDNLEEIVVSRAYISYLEEVGKKPYDFQRRRKKLYPRLKSLVFLAAPAADSHQQFPFYDVREESQLTTLWTNVLDINCPELKNSQLKSLCWNSSKEEIHAGIRLNELESYWEPKALLMKSIRAPTKLRLVNCYYDSEKFQEFCRSSPLIEVLKLDYDQDMAFSSEWNTESWKSLSKLRVLSLKAQLIEGKQDESEAPLMMSVFQSCPLIQELEIMGRSYGNETLVVDTRELSSIAQCTQLKRLTLSNLRVKNGNFLEEILLSCTKLETLRLKQIGPEKARCSYVTNLCKALPSARNLRTFCLFQMGLSYDSQSVMVLDSLEQNCPLLSRLALVLPSDEGWKIGKEELKSRFLRFCENLTNLVALFTYFRVPFDHWNETNLALKEKFEGERPAFRAELTSPQSRFGDYWGGDFDDQEYSSGVLPVMHGDVLTCFESQVAVFPIDCQSFLQRTFR